MAPANLFKALPLLASNLRKPMCMVATRQLSSGDLVNIKRPTPPSSYNLPIRRVNMDDLMEPYGSWQEAYAKDNKKANIALFKGIVAFALCMTIFFQSGITDGLLMPNLDNIIADTDQYKEEMYGIDRSDRATPQLEE